MNIGLLSDTHGFLDPSLIDLFSDCDELWHAGDIGTPEVLDALEEIKPVRAVFGNIDGGEIRQKVPEWQEFSCDGVKVLMTHIGGYPGRYARGIKPVLLEHKPDLFICGHSHILKVIYDKELSLLHMNPGAAGKQGMHLIRTALRFQAIAGKIKNVEVLELGKRGAITG